MAERVYRKATEGGETRAMRGLQLYRDRGDEIVTYPTTGEYGVPSRTEPGELYVVDLDRETCECASYRYSGGACLHLVAAEMKRREAARKKAPKPAAGRRCSAPPMAVRSKMARDFMSRMGAARCW